MTFMNMANKQHISDEQLAAYLDGNVNEKEMLQFLQTVKSDKELQEVFDIALRVEGEQPQFGSEELPMLQKAALSGENICAVHKINLVNRSSGT